MKSTPAPRAKIDDLEANVRLAVQHRRFKEAIVFFKDLLKQERRPDWEQGLADAYRQRALQVADKGMWQEALVLWENQMKLAPQAPPSDAYLGWLVQAGQFPKLAKLLAEAHPALEQGMVGKRLPETLAVLALQNEKLLAALPPEHAIAKHHAIIKQAIKAYCAGRDAESEEALRQIPSRSPYRNVRTLLKALLLMGQDRAAGLAILERIEADSACQGLVRSLLRHAQPTGPALADTTELPLKQQALIHKLNGYGKAQLNLLRDAKKLAKATSHKLVFNTVLGNREVFGDATCRRFCLALLVDYPEGMEAYQKAFGKLSLFEIHRLYALHEETPNHYPQAADYWEYATEALAKRPEPERDRLDEALIWRHVAELTKPQTPDLAVDALAKSLTLDPDDQPSYLALIQLSEQLEEPKEAQEWLDKGLKRFPKDVELLGLAMRSAHRRKAFKKAAGLAKTLLEIDPINTPARQLLTGAHIGHARKQFRAGRVDLAQQELKQARALDPYRRNASLCILEGLLLRQRDKPAAARLLQEGWHLAGGGLCAQLQINIEAFSLDLPLNTITGLVPSLDKSHTASRTELAGLVKLMSEYAEEKRLLTDALKPLKALLKRSIKQPGLSEDDYFNLGQALARSAQFDLLEDCAKAAAQRFVTWPAATYFRIYAKCKGVAERMTPADEDALEYALERAAHAKDHRTGLLISNFFRKLEESEEEYFDEDLPPGFENMESKLTPDLIQRVMELDSLPHAELLAMVSEALPGLPLKSLPHRELLNMARLILMGELGLDLEGLLGGSSPFGSPKKLPKSR